MGEEAETIKGAVEQAVEDDEEFNATNMWKVSATRVPLTPLFLGTVGTPIPRTDTTTTGRKTPFRTPVE